MSSNLAFQGTGCKVQYKSSCSCSSVRHGTLGSLHNQLQFLSIRFIIINTIKIINYYYNSKIYIIINIQFGGAGFLMFQWMWLCMFPAWQSLSQKSASSFFFSRTVNSGSLYLSDSELRHTIPWCCRPIGIMLGLKLNQKMKKNTISICLSGFVLYIYLSNCMTDWLSLSDYNNKQKKTTIESRCTMMSVRNPKQSSAKILCTHCQCHWSDLAYMWQCCLGVIMN